MFAKHNPRLRAIIPFGNDPYDAVGSFGTIVGMLIALLSLVRAFRPYHKQPPTNAECVYLVRSQEAVVLAVLLTLLADTVALARHASLWSSAASGRELILLLGGMAVITLGVQSLVRNSRRQMADTRSTPWGRAISAVHHIRAGSLPGTPGRTYRPSSPDRRNRGVRSFRADASPADLARTLHRRRRTSWVGTKRCQNTKSSASMGHRGRGWALDWCVRFPW
jgi:hypothetical protein